MPFTTLAGDQDRPHRHCTTASTHAMRVAPPHAIRKPCAFKRRGIPTADDASNGGQNASNGRRCFKWWAMPTLRALARTNFDDRRVGTAHQSYARTRTDVAYPYGHCPPTLRPCTHRCRLSVGWALPTTTHILIDRNKTQWPPIAGTWRQLLAIRLLLVPIGVGVGIGIGIDSDCILRLVLTHGVALLP
jgi:hypothetical protein